MKIARISSSQPRQFIRSGSPGGSHPRAPTDPYVTVSRHTALVILISWRPVSPRPSVPSTAVGQRPRGSSPGWLSSRFGALPRQFRVIWENRRCSILFHLLVPGGRWQTLMSRPVSAASAASSVFQLRRRLPLAPPEWAASPRPELGGAVVAPHGPAARVPPRREQVPARWACDPRARELLVRVAAVSEHHQGFVGSAFVEPARSWDQAAGAVGVAA